MSASPQRFPLAWPAHRPRKRPADRRKGSFVADKRSITMAAAVDKLDDQIDRLGGRYPILSSNVETRMDGRPRSGQARPADPGVCVYFELKGQPMAMACDTFTTVEQNIAAIANHIDVVRRQATYGVASAEESLQAFAALPAPGAIMLGNRTAWQVLGLEPRSSSLQIERAHKRLAAELHPDRGGSDAAMAELNAARDAALKEIQS